MPNLFRSRFLVLWLVNVSACASAARQEPVFVEANEQTVTTRLEAAYSGRGQHVVVENRSSVPIFVTSLHLQECQNIKNSCEVKRLRIPVDPGQSRQVATVQTKNSEQASNFRYHWTWEVQRGAPQPQ